MSDIWDPTFELDKAATHNLRVWDRLHHQIPDGAKEAYPGLAVSLAAGHRGLAHEFTQAVLDFQVEWNTTSPSLAEDGMLGRETLYALGRHSRYSTLRVMVDGTQVPTNALVSDLPGTMFNYRRVTDRRRSVRALVLHWPGGPADARGLHAYLQNTDRSVSTHFGVDLSGTYQYLDTNHVAWHAGTGEFAGDENAETIGIDICQAIVAKHLKYTEAVEVVPNPSSRGERRVLGLHPATAKHTAHLCRELCRIYKLDVVPAPERDAVYGIETVLSKGYTIVGHHHLASSKWDIAPWWDDVVRATSEDAALPGAPPGRQHVLERD